MHSKHHINQCHSLRDPAPDSPGPRWSIQTWPWDPGRGQGPLGCGGEGVATAPGSSVPYHQSHCPSGEDWSGPGCGQSRGRPDALVAPRYMWGHHLQTYLNITFCVLFRLRPRIYTEPLPVGTAPLAMGGRRGAAPHETPDSRHFLGGEFSVAEAMSSVQRRRNGF